MSNRLDRFNEFRELDRILLVMKRGGTSGRELRPNHRGTLRDHRGTIGIVQVFDIPTAIRAVA